ncbi:MAG: GTP-binding protein, partial [Thiobacillaceae bacterium]
SPTLKNLWMARNKGNIPAFERVVIETTGIADPAPILEVLLNDSWLRARFRLDGVVTTIDAVLGAQQLDSYFEAVKQVAVADRLILTKTDLARADQTASLQARLQALNPAAEIMPVISGDLDPGRLLNLGLYNTETKTPDVKRWLNEARYRPAKPHALGRNISGMTQDNHDQRIHAFSLLIDEPVSRNGLQAALTMLISFRSEYLLRFKAIVNVQGEDKPLVLHGVQHVLYPEVRLEAWPDEDHRSRFVFIVRDLEPPFIAKVLQDFTQAAQGNL